MKKLPISVSMISGAEAHRIEKALASVAAWTSEIIVVLNSEVADGTDQLAAKFGAKVFRHPWHGFREQKNLALQYSTQPWILALDADEEVSPGLAGSIAGLVEQNDSRVQGGYFPRKVWFLGRWIVHGDWYPDHVLRLFRSGKGKWAGSPEHCKIELEGASVKLAGDLHHYTNPTISSYVQKINYFADLYLERQLAARTRWSSTRVIVRSFWRFFRAYFLRLGFLDGYPGFFIAASTAYAALVRHSRLYEHAQPKLPPCATPSSP